MLSSLLPWLTLGGCALMGLQLALCFRAEAPRKGSTEWITMYEKPAFSPAGNDKALEKKDTLFAVVAAFVQMLAFALFLFVPLMLAGKDIATEVNWSSAGPIFLAAGGSGAVLYLLVKLLTRSAPAALLATLPLAGDIFRDPMASLFLLCALLSLYLFFTRGEGFWALDLLGIGTCAMAACVFFFPSTTLLLPVFLLTLLLDGAWRLIKGCETVWQVLLRLVLTVCVFFLLLGAMCTSLFPIDFVEALKNGTFFKTVLLYLEGFRHITALKGGAILAALMQLPSVIYAVGSLVLIVWALLKKRDAAAAFLLLWSLALMAFSFLTGASYYVLPAALSCGYLAARCFKRDAITTGVGGAAVLTALNFAITAAIYF